MAVFLPGHIRSEVPTSLLSNKWSPFGADSLFRLGRYIENSKNAFQKTLDYWIVSMDGWEDNAPGAETVETRYSMFMQFIPLQVIVNQRPWNKRNSLPFQHALNVHVYVVVDNHAAKVINLKTAVDRIFKS